MVQSFNVLKGCTFMHTSILLAIFTLFTLTACSVNTLKQEVTLPSQNINDYADNFKTIPTVSLPQTLFEKHFMPWKQESITLSYEQATWGKQYASQKMYGLNYKRIDSSWFEEEWNNANFEAFNSLNQKAITIKNTHLRVFPTSLPLFFNPHKVAEGFPFDYNQNSGIKINTPIMISHFSKDKAWAFVQSSFASGFIPTHALAKVNETILKAFEKSEYYIAIEDDFSLYKNGVFKEKIKLGTVFPKSQYGNFFVVNQHANLDGYLQTVTLPHNAVVKNGLTMNAHNIKHIIQQLSQEPYGWGEAFFKRDCSALTKDYFAAFGVHLNRNSSQQTKDGTYISLKEFDNATKKNILITQGKPFRSLLYLKGHIMLYLGVSANNEPLVFHNMWGIKTYDWLNNENRVIVGQAVITDLEVGKELAGFDSNHSLLSKIEALVIIK
jgi:hypothetical protein